MSTAARRYSPKCEDLTDRQREIYAWIFEETRRLGVQPSRREIGAHFDITSPNGVGSAILALSAKGYVSVPDKQSRSLVFLRLPDGSPFLGFAPIRETGGQG